MNNDNIPPIIRVEQRQYENPAGGPPLIVTKITIVGDIFRAALRPLENLFHRFTGSGTSSIARPEAIAPHSHPPSNNGSPPPDPMGSGGIPPPIHRLQPPSSSGDPPKTFHPLPNRQDERPDHKNGKLDTSSKGEGNDKKIEEPKDKKAEELEKPPGEENLQSEPSEEEKLAKEEREEAKLQLLEKLLNLIPLKNIFPHSNLPRLFPKDKADFTEQVSKGIQNKGETASQGKHLTQGQRLIPEEIERVARSQETEQNQLKQLSENENILKTLSELSENKLFKKQEESILELAIAPHKDMKKMEDASKFSKTESPKDPNVQLKMYHAGIQSQISVGAVYPAPINPPVMQAPLEPTLASPIEPIVPIQETHLNLSISPPTPNSVAAEKTSSGPLAPLLMNPLSQNQTVNPTALPIDARQISQVHAGKEIKPRLDAVVSLEKNENKTNLHAPRDDRDIVRVPVLPDPPLSKENLFKDLGKGKNNISIDEEGGRFSDVILMLLCGVLCGARSIGEICRYLEARSDFFKVWLGLKNFMPSYRLCAFLLGRIDPKYFQQLIQMALGLNPLDLNSQLQFVQVWESDRGLILGQSSKDIFPIPIEAIMPCFDLSGSTVNVNHLKLQKDLVNYLVGQGARYFIALKGGHGVSFDKAQEFFESTLKENSARFSTDLHREVNQEANRSELKEILATSHLDWFAEGINWKSLNTAIKLTIESMAGNRTETEKRLFLSSAPLDAKMISYELRCLPMIEKRTVWSLDVDLSEWTVNHVRENLEHLRTFSLKLLNNASLDSLTPEARRKKALVNTKYLRQLLSL